MPDPRAHRAAGLASHVIPLRAVKKRTDNIDIRFAAAIALPFNGDICAWHFKKVAGYNVQLEWSNAQNKCV